MNKLILTIILIVLVGLFVGGTVFILTRSEQTEENKDEFVSIEAAGAKALAYINEYLLGETDVAASLLEIKEESGLYKIKIKIEEDEFESYVSKDGKVLFPQFYDLNYNLPSSEEEGVVELPEEIPQTEKGPLVELFVMSFCPYGNQAEELMKPVEELLGDKVDIKVRYVIYDNYRGGGADFCLADGKYCSMHGIQELNQGVRELCVYKYQKDKFWNFLEAINKSCNYQNVDSCWEGVAQAQGIDVAKIKNCQANEALAILAEEVAFSKKYGVTGSPDLIINGSRYKGARTSEAYKEAICAAFQTPPAECNQALSADTGGATGSCQ